MRRQDTHHERIRKFKETLDINKALIRQIVLAIDKQYINEFGNIMTNTINKTIPDILVYIFNNFPDITSSDVAKEEQKVNNNYWNFSDPPIFFYNIIDDL